MIATEREIYSDTGTLDREDMAVPRSPVVTLLSAVRPEPVEWLWPGRLARGKYTLLAGEPGLGKTFMLLDVAARISCGGVFPDGTVAPRGRILILTAEDGLSDTIRPRLDALGADSSQIAALEAVREPDGSLSALSLVRDIGMLAAAVEAVQPSIVLVDPLSAYLGQTDTHRDAEVRGALAPLIALAEQERFALAAICHLSKDSQKAALHRPGGSIAFVAAARLVLALAADPNDPDRRLLASIKSNICRPAPTLAYRIAGDRLHWEASPVEMDAAAIFQQGSPADREERTEAERVLVELLADEDGWPMEAKDALAAGVAHGISERTLQRAAKRIGIRIDRLGFGRGGRWLWHRPAIADIGDRPSPRAETVAPMASMGNPSEKEGEIGNSVHRRHVSPVLGALQDQPFHFDEDAFGTRDSKDAG